MVEPVETTTLFGQPHFFMKKTLLLITALFASLFLVSCGKKTLLDEHGCFESIEEAVNSASKSKKDILLFITQCPSETCDAFTQAIFASDLFKEDFSKNYTIAHIDFGESFAEKTLNAESEKISQRYSEALFSNSVMATCLSTAYIPAAYLLTSEGYYIADLNYSGDTSTAIDLKTKLDAVKEKAQNIHSHLAATKTGTVSNKMEAINWFYENISPEYIYTYVPLFYEGCNLDKKDESGYVSKFYVKYAILDAVKFAQINDIATAVASLEAAAKSGKLKGPEKQEVLYQAGAFLLQNEMGDYETIANYFEAAILANPEGEVVPQLQYVVDYLRILSSDSQDYIQE